MSAHTYIIHYLFFYLKVSQLIIQNEAYEAGDKDAFPADLIPSATSVMKSTEGLVDAARRLATDSVDEVKLKMNSSVHVLSLHFLLNGTNNYHPHLTYSEKPFK